MTTLTVNKRINLVLEIERDDGSVAHVHSVPIGRNVWQANHMFLTAAMGDMYARLNNPIAVSRIAYYHMLEMIKTDKAWANVEQSLFAEIWRLTNVMMPTERGWETVPFYDVMQRKLLDEDDIAEVQNYLCFFTGLSWVHTRRERAGMYELLEASGARPTSLDSTEYKSSLPTLKPEGSSGATATPSFIPS